LAGTLAFIDTGAQAAQVLLYDGVRAASADTAPGVQNRLLVAVPLTQPAGSVAAGTLTLTPQGPGLIALSGTPTWARLVNGDGSAVLDADVGVGAGAWEVQLAQAELFAGGDAKITSFALT
jgi:hypothetical protein